MRLIWHCNTLAISHSVLSKQIGRGRRQLFDKFGPFVPTFLPFWRCGAERKQKEAERRHGAQPLPLERIALTSLPFHDHIITVSLLLLRNCGRNGRHCAAGAARTISTDDGAATGGNFFGTATTSSTTFINPASLAEDLGCHTSLPSNEGERPLNRKGAPWSRWNEN